MYKTITKLLQTSADIIRRYYMLSYTNIPTYVVIYKNNLFN